MAETDKLNIDNIITQLLQGNYSINFSLGLFIFNSRPWPSSFYLFLVFEALFILISFNYWYMF